MVLWRASVVALIMAMAIQYAGAQPGDIPGLPHWSPRAVDPPATPQPQCQELLTLRSELGKYEAAITAANSKKWYGNVTCPLFRSYVRTSAKLLKALDMDGASCGAPAKFNLQIQAIHSNATLAERQVCDSALRQRVLPGGLPLFLDDDELRPFKLNLTRRPESRYYETH